MARQKGTPAAFWRWFAANAERFRNSKPPYSEALLDELLDQLHLYNDALFFEIGGEPDGPCELVVTAEGRTDFFESVNCLIAAAPKIDGWRFVALKPAQGFEFVTRYGKAEIDPGQCWFCPLLSEDAPDQLGLLVACPGYTKKQHNDYANGVRIVLDTGLGELAAAEEVQHVEVGPLPKNPEADGYIELPQLPAYLAWRRGKAK